MHTRQLHRFLCFQLQQPTKRTQNVTSKCNHFFLGSQEAPDCSNIISFCTSSNGQAKLQFSHSVRAQDRSMLLLRCQTEDSLPPEATLVSTRSNISQLLLGLFASSSEDDEKIGWCRLIRLISHARSTHWLASVLQKMTQCWDRHVVFFLLSYYSSMHLFSFMD